MRYHAAVIATLLVLVVVVAPVRAAPAGPGVPWCVSDYDSGDWYWLRDGIKTSFHGMREAWVFNRGLSWLDEASGLDGAVLCHSHYPTLELTGHASVSKWFADPANVLKDVDVLRTRLVHKADRPTDYAQLPSFQFHLGQHPRAELEVSECDQPWQFLVAVKGRSGPPLYASSWSDRPGKLSVDLAALMKGRTYGEWAQLHFFVCTWRREPRDASVTFRLRLAGQPAIVTTLPMFRTVAGGKHRYSPGQVIPYRGGTPLYAIMVDEKGFFLREKDASVWAELGDQRFNLTCRKDGVWEGQTKELKEGEHEVVLRSTRVGRPRETLETRLRIHVGKHEFIAYDGWGRLLTLRDANGLANKPLGPLTGSYRGQMMFQDIGTSAERPLHGQARWEQRRNQGEGQAYGFHWWESLTPAELDTEFEYLARCGWTLVHLCQGWIWWERLDAGGCLAPHGAQQLAAVLAAARRHGLRVHFALSHYPLGKASKPYAQYMEAGYKPSDYGDTKSRFYEMFAHYLDQFSAVFRDASVLGSLTAAGEGDPSCGGTFVRFVRDRLYKNDVNHILLCEPHGHITRDPEYYKTQEWGTLLGGFRTYALDKKPLSEVAVAFRLAPLGRLFMAEGLFWGYMNGAYKTDEYRLRVRETIYTALAARSPIVMTWEERAVEDERVVFEQVRRSVDWSRPATGGDVKILIDGGNLDGTGRQRLARIERLLSRVPVQSLYITDALPVERGIDATKEQPLPDWLTGRAELPQTLRLTLPLVLPEGMRAFYTWSDDRTVLLAFIRAGRAAVEERLSAPTTEAGHYTYADTQLALSADMEISRWEAICESPGKVQLRIYRAKDNTMTLVGRSELVEMKARGPVRFELARPIQARAGDLIGLYVPDESTHVAAHGDGRMLFVEGDAGETPTPLANWKSEPKTLCMCVTGTDGRTFPARGDDAAASAPAARASTRPVGKLLLQNLPDVRLKVRLYDLAAKKVIHESVVHGQAEIPVPAGAEHLFLTTTPVPE